MDTQFDLRYRHRHVDLKLVRHAILTDYQHYRQKHVDDVGASVATTMAYVEAAKHMSPGLTRPTEPELVKAWEDYCTSLYAEALARVKADLSAPTPTYKRPQT